LGKPHLVYAWVGRDASDVVIKLTKKALDSYFDHLNDGRSLDRSEWDSSDRNKAQQAKEALLKESGSSSTATPTMRKKTDNKSGVLRMDLLVVRDGKEPADFRVFFLGWGDEYHVDGVTDTAQLEQWQRGVLPLTKRTDEPLNQFLREEQERLRQYRLKKAAKEQQAQTTSTKPK
jgi:hypothetical protein